LLEDGEHGLHSDIAAQYRNWFEPAGAVPFLRRLTDSSPLNAEHTQLRLDRLKDSPTGAHRIKAELPRGGIVMHQTGMSGTKDGITFATNDVGLIILPDGRRLALAVFVTDTKADEATRDAAIARIAKAVCAAATKGK
jgi:beta-lactamase class A